MSVPCGGMAGAPLEAVLPDARPSTTLDDALLIARVRRADRAALAELYDRHGPSLLALARRILASDDEAEDLLHHVFVEVIRDARTYDRARGSVRSWLITKTRSRALDRLRSRRRRRELAAERYVCALSQERAFELSDRLGVRMVLGHLPSHMRTVLELAYFEGRTANEIADELDVPIGTVKSRISRATARLRGILDVSRR